MTFAFQKKRVPHQEDPLLPIEFNAYSDHPMRETTRSTKGQRFMDNNREILLEVVLSLVDSYLEGSNPQVAPLLRDLASLALSCQGFFALAQHGFKQLDRYLAPITENPIPGINWDQLLCRPSRFRKKFLKSVIKELQITSSKNYGGNHYSNSLLSYLICYIDMIMAILAHFGLHEKTRFQAKVVFWLAEEKRGKHIKFSKVLEEEDVLEDGEVGHEGGMGLKVEGRPGGIRTAVSVVKEVEEGGLEEGELEEGELEEGELEEGELDEGVSFEAVSGIYNRTRSRLGASFQFEQVVDMPEVKELEEGELEEGEII